MRSLARRTKERKAAQQLAAQKAQSNGQKVPVAGDATPRKTAAQAEYDALLVVLHDDVRKISEIASIEARNPIKRDKMAQYRPWVDGVLQAGEGADSAAPDEIVATMLIWALDIGDFEFAMAIARHMLAFGLPLPERFDRSTGCYVAETLAELSLKNDDVPHAILVEAHELTKADVTTIPDQARAKMFKALGRSALVQIEAHDPNAENAVAGQLQALQTSALAHFEQALALNSKAGVKRNITDLKKALQPQD